MMLEALVALAEREGLLEDTSYGKRLAHFQVRIDDEGTVLGVVPLGDQGKGQVMSMPAVAKRSGTGTQPVFLVDNAQYALGFAKRTKGQPPDDRAIGRARECADAFANMIDEASVATKDHGLCAVAAFLRRLESQRDRILSLSSSREWSGDETIAFLRDADGETYVHARPAVRAYWSSKRAEPSTAPNQRCLVTGAMAPAARLHDVIKRIPEAQSSGASLVSFNKPAFTSHGFAQGANAPVSQRAADGYVRALNWLLERDGERRFRSGLLVGGDSVMLFWTRDRHAISDILLELFSPTGANDDDLRSVFESALAGLRPRDIDTTKFYALTMGGNASRAVVRDWLETTASDVKANLRRWFDDLALAGDDGAPLSIARLLRSLEVTPTAQDRRGVTSVLASKLLRAALTGGPAPRELLYAALGRMRLPPRDGEWRGTLRARVALIKLVLRRLQPDRSPEVTVSLDETSQSVPYLLGRLFAAVEKLQGDSTGAREVNATIRDKYFGAASATPGLVFPRLLRISMHHASKASSDGRGFAERVKASIIDRLPAAEPFPRTLPLEAQGLFAVGYYHQRQAFFTKQPAEPEPQIPQEASK